jgi:hypothetical protein
MAVLSGLAGMKLTSYWLDTAPRFVGGSRQPLAEVMNGRPELNPWREFDWPAIPDHFGRPWFLPLVGAYYRLRDRFD